MVMAIVMTNETPGTGAGVDRGVAATTPATSAALSAGATARRKLIRDIRDLEGRKDERASGTGRP
jgi:hypothetical protein